MGDIKRLLATEYWCSSALTLMAAVVDSVSEAVTAVRRYTSVHGRPI